MFWAIFCKPRSRYFAAKALVAAFVTLSLFSCTAVTKQENRPVNGSRVFSNNQLLAENSMMKKRLSLIEREDDVLKRENRQHRMRIQELETQNKQLGQELDVMKEKYAIDMLIGEEQNNSLQEIIEKIKKETSERMLILIAEKKVLEEQIVRERRFFNDQIDTVKAAGNEQREKIIQANTQMELNLTAQLDVLNEKLEAKEREISLLEAVISAQNEPAPDPGGGQALTSAPLSPSPSTEATH
ncbi:MAG: hypothetical protein WC913_00720 [Desulfuromonas sp.]